MKVFALFLFLLSVNIAFSQDRTTFKKNIDYRAEQKTAAQQHIANLSSGVLLVRLNFEKRRIAYYEKFKDTVRAQREINKIKEQQLKENTAIIEAFNKYFTFCPVYFFARADSHKLLNGDIDSVMFYNTIAQPDSSISLPQKSFYVAEFGVLEPDTMYYKSDQIPNTSNPDTNRRSTYYVKGNQRSALLLRDDHLRQLSDPFPFFVSYSFFSPVRKRYKGPVRRLNEKLGMFWASLKE